MHYKSDILIFLTSSIPVPMKIASRPKFYHQQLGLSSIQTHTTAQPTIPLRLASGHFKVKFSHCARFPIVPHPTLPILLPPFTQIIADDVTPGGQILEILKH